MSTIGGIDVPKVGDTNYQVKIENTLNAVDIHDHSLNKGDPVTRIASSGLDNSTLELDGSNKVRVKPSGITSNELGAGLGSVPLGSMIMYLGTTAPSGYLLCDGSQVSQTTYAALFAVIGESWGAKVGSSTFALPDRRGTFAMGRIDSTADADAIAAGRDPGYSSRTALTAGGATGANTGSYQVDEIKSHRHLTKTEFQGQRGGGSSGDSGTDTGTTSSSGAGTTTSGELDSATTITNGTDGLVYSIFNSGESRPVNMAVNYLIKY
jgi:microcystin-dependent protein